VLPSLLSHPVEAMSSPSETHYHTLYITISSDLIVV
jgi:hypothetical protein